MDANRLRLLIDDGKYADAEAAAIELIDAGQRSFAAYALLAKAARHQGHFDTAVAALREAAALKPDDPGAWMELGELLTLTARWTEALRAFRLACELAPSDTEPLLALAGAQLASRRVADAARTSSRLVDRFPAAPESHVLKASIERAFGRRKSAIAAYRQALQLDPVNAVALLGLSELEDPATTPALAEWIQSARSSAESTLEQRVQLEFALARLHDREGRVDEAFESFAAASALQREFLAARGIHCHRANMAAWLRTAKIRYPRSPATAPLQSSGADLLPIFIVGLPRSGTTLAEQILASHPLVAAGGELTAASVIYGDYLRARAHAGLPWPVNPLDAGERRLLADARERYVEQVIGHAGDARYVTDKHPGNSVIVGFLRLIFPESPVVHVQRDPVATCWSIFTSYLPGSSACFTSLEDIAHYHSAHGELMRFWASICDPPMLDLRYEQLVTDPDSRIRALVADCGLPWAESCLHPEAALNAVTTASVDQVRIPIHRDAIDRHRRYDRYLAPLRLALETTSAEL